jgi:hypothetical protein
MPSSGILRRVALVITDVSEEHIASITRAKTVSELETTLAVSEITDSLRPDYGGDNVPPKRRFLQEPHGVTSQKTALFIVTAMKTATLT